MLSDELRKRLADMHRRPEPVKESAPTDISPFRERLARAAQALEQRQGTVFPEKTMDQVLKGREVKTASGQFYLVEPEPQSLHDEIHDITHKLVHWLPFLDPVSEALRPVDRDMLSTSPERFLYLDIETTGFSGVPLFLIGLMFIENGNIQVAQLLARDYSEEAPVLEYLAEQFPRFDCLITFNGKTFDIPYIRDRYFANAIRCRFPQKHLDLLTPSRRRWREKLPNCRLQTLEKWICGRGRDGDIPGTDIPDTYHLFVRTGNAALLDPILEHNALDLVSMGEVLLHLVKP